MRLRVIALLALAALLIRCGTSPLPEVRYYAIADT